MTVRSVKARWWAVLERLAKLIYDVTHLLSVNQMIQLKGLIQGAEYFINLSHFCNENSSGRHENGLYSPPSAVIVIA